MLRIEGAEHVEVDGGLTLADIVYHDEPHNKIALTEYRRALRTVMGQVSTGIETQALSGRPSAEAILRAGLAILRVYLEASQ